MIIKIYIIYVLNVCKSKIFFNKIVFFNYILKYNKYRLLRDRMRRIE